MSKEDKISPQAVLSLKEALCVIFWKKEDLQSFIRVVLPKNPFIVYLSWNLTKREVVRELIDRITGEQDIYKNDLVSLFVAVSTFDDFSNLKFWDDDGSKTKKAKLAVANLKTYIKGNIQQTQAQEENQKRTTDTERKILKSKSLEQDLKGLKSRFNILVHTKDLQKRGYELEKFLYDLFLLYELEPKGSFKNQGEQLDGAFTFQGNDYLLEAKWKRQVDRGDLADFCYKVETKLKTALGLLVTIDGVTPEAISPHFKSIIIMDGLDITAVLEEHISLTDLLFRKRRKAIETGNIYLNVNKL